MITKLLQEILDLLKGLDTEEIKKISDNVGDIDAVINAINSIISEILSDTGSIDDSTKDVDEKMYELLDRLVLMHTELVSLNNTLNTASHKLTAINNHVADLVTPISAIKINSDTEVSKLTLMTSKIEEINNFMSTLSTSASRSASYNEDTATNTQHIYEKIVTVASDTTQMRADNQAIIEILNKIYDEIKEA